jgi:segregation and condensation protein B
MDDGKKTELEIDALDADVENLSADFVTEEAAFIAAESNPSEEDGFLPKELDQESSEDDSETLKTESVEGTELEGFESAEIEEYIFVEEERLTSIIESVLFASDRPVSLASLKMLFKGTNVKSDRLRWALDRLAVQYADVSRGVTLEEVTGGYQLRTKLDNLEFLKRTVKTRQFKLSGPALEVLSITAYKQPVVKYEIDEIRGVESGHLLRALMEKGLVNFQGKSDLPGKPMQYGTTKKFLEIFGLRNLKELPTLSQIDEILPEGIGDEDEAKKGTLSDITDSMSQQVASTYSDGEEELMSISESLQKVDTTTEFFEQEKLREKQRRDAEKAQSIREALAMGEQVSTRDCKWLVRYDMALSQANEVPPMSAAADQPVEDSESMRVPDVEAAQDLESPLKEAIEKFDTDEDLDEASFDQILDQIDDESDSDQDSESDDLNTPYHDKDDVER